MNTMNNETWKDLVKGAVENGATSAEKLKDHLKKDLESMEFKYSTLITTTTTKNDGGTQFDYNGHLWYANVQFDAWTFRAFLAKA